MGRGVVDSLPNPCSSLRRHRAIDELDVDGRICKLALAHDDTGRTGMHVPPSPSNGRVQYCAGVRRVVRCLWAWRRWRCVYGGESHGFMLDGAVAAMVVHE